MSDNNTKSPDKVTLKIPRPLYEKIAQVIRGAGYNSVTDFVVYVLRDLVASHGVTSGNAASREADDLLRVKRRLEALGYLDSQTNQDSIQGLKHE